MAHGSWGHLFHLNVSEPWKKNLGVVLRRNLNPLSPPATEDTGTLTQGSEIPEKDEVGLHRENHSRARSRGHSSDRDKGQRSL